MRPRHLFPAALCLLLINCHSNDHSAKDNPLDETIVLKVSSVTITGYELDKNMAILRSAFLRKNKSLPKADDIKEQIGAFIDRTYFLADAVSKGYDTLGTVKDQVKGMAHFIITQGGRPTDQKMTPEKKKIQDSAHILINEEILAQLVNRLPDSVPIHNFDKQKFRDLSDSIILTYQIEDKLVKVSLNGFMDYYNALPIRSAVKDVPTVQYFLGSMAIDNWRWMAAERSGLTRQPQFLLDEENYRKSVIYRFYEEQELRRGINTPEEEIMARYETRKMKYLVADKIVISYYTFSNRSDAAARMFALRRGPAGPPNKGKPMDSSLHLMQDHDSRLFSPDIRTRLFAMKNGEVSRPIPWRDKYLIVVRESGSGNRIQPLEEVRGVIVRELEEEKLEARKKALLPRLKAIYPITNNIDYAKYLSESKD